MGAVHWPSVLGWSVVSICAHGLFFVVLFVLALPGMDPYERSRPDELAITILPTPEPEVAPTVEPELEPELPQEPEMPPELEPEIAPAALIQQPRDPRSSLEPTEAQVVEPSGSGVASSIEVPDVSPSNEPRLSPEEQRRRMTALLAPDSVARGGFVATGPGPSRPSGPAGIAPLRRPGPSEVEIERGLSGGLRSQAMTKAYITHDPVVPRRQSDGSYAWDGPRFRGIIRPDGEVQFEDRPAVSTNGFSASGSFDLTDAIMGSAGQDPLRAERDRFMRETEELRARLEAEYRRGESSRGLRTLRGRLARDWARTDRSAAARRRRLFSYWDEMADDDTGREGRRIVLEFIRENLPSGSDAAYSARDVERLNASRESTERFEPY
jgi:hypothetical protein